MCFFTKPQLNVTFGDLRDLSLLSEFMRLAIIQACEINNPKKIKYISINNEDKAECKGNVV